MLHRRLLVAAIATAVLVISSATVWAGNHQGGARPVGPPPRAATVPTKRPVPPSTDKVPQSELRTANPVQQQVDAELAQAETPAAISAAERFSVPAPGVSTAYPSVPMADRGDPGAYATAFTTELLDTNFATQSRGELLSWAEYEEAPNTLPGVPASVAGKALVLSLADPDLPGGSPSPVPSAPQWVADAQSAHEPERHRRASRDRPRLDADHLARVAAPRRLDDRRGGHREPDGCDQRCGWRTPAVLPHRDLGVGRARRRRLRRRGGVGLDARLMGCSLTDPVGCLTSLAGGAAGSIADSAFSDIAKDFADAAGSAVNWLWNQISGATAISLSGPAFAKDLAIVSTLAVVVATGLFVIQVIASVLRRDGSGLTRALKGLLIAFVGSVAAIAVTTLLLAAVDALSAGFVSVATGDSMSTMGTAILSATAITAIANPGRRPALGPGRSWRGDLRLGGDDGAQAPDRRGCGVRPLGLCRRDL